MRLLMRLQCENCKKNTKNPECLVGPDDERCLKCKAEKRGCSFKETKSEQVEEDEVEILPAKRPRRDVGKKERAAIAYGAAGPSSRSVEVRERKSIVRAHSDLLNSCL
jgi:hypothetical protein